MHQLRGSTSGFSSVFNTKNHNKRTDNVHNTSTGEATSVKSKSLCVKMDINKFDTANLDFYESDLAIEQITSKLRAEDKKLVASIPKISFGEDGEGNLDTPEISLNLSDYIDTPELNKFTSGEGLFPQIHLLTGSQEPQEDLHTPTPSVSTEVPSLVSPGKGKALPQIVHVTVSKTEVVETPQFVEEVVVDSEHHNNLLDHCHVLTDVADNMEVGLENYSGFANVIVKKEAGMDSVVMIPEEDDISESNSYVVDCDTSQLVDVVPTPVALVGEDYTRDSLESKSPSPYKSSIRKRELEKGSEEYRMKRERNNVAVRKSREKARERQRVTEQKVKTLTVENKQLHKKMDLLNKELAVLRGLFANANIRALLPTQHQKLLDKLSKQNQ